MDTDKFIKLFGNCIIVPGHTRSILCDLQKETSHVIPNSIYELSKLFDYCSIKEIKEKYDDESNLLIDRYFAYLIDKGFAFLCDKNELDLFPNMSLEWDYPAIITNALIDINEQSRFNFSDIFQQLEALVLAP